MEKMSKHEQILELIKQIRNSHSAMVDIFTKGSCINLYQILKVVYPEAEAWTNEDHIITSVEGIFYDIKGQVTKGLERFVKFDLAYSKDRAVIVALELLNAEWEPDNINTTGIIDNHYQSTTTEDVNLFEEF